MIESRTYHLRSGDETLTFNHRFVKPVKYRDDMNFLKRARAYCEDNISGAFLVAMGKVGTVELYFARKPDALKALLTLY